MAGPVQFVHRKIPKLFGGALLSPNRSAQRQFMILTIFDNSLLPVTVGFWKYLKVFVSKPRPISNPKQCIREEIADIIYAMIRKATANM